MKLGIVASGFDMLGLFKFLNKFDFEYHIYYDWNSGYYGDKDIKFSTEKVKEGIQYLESQGVDSIIVPPVYELLISNPKIIPLFKEYILSKCLPFSLVGKIGFIGDYADMQEIESLFKSLSSSYQLTENQKSIKKFHKPFALWKKETYMWKYFLQKISFRNFALSKIIKFDLKYLKDAGVDTIIPLNYGYFLYDVLIKNKLNTNKIRFHGMNDLEEIFKKLIDPTKSNNGKYSVNIHCNGGKQIISNEKKWMWLLQRGKEINLEFNNI